MFKTLRQAYKNHQRRQRTIRELSVLTDRELADLGISRADIYHIASQNPLI